MEGVVNPNEDDALYTMNMQGVIFMYPYIKLENRSSILFAKFIISGVMVHFLL